MRVVLRSSKSKDVRVMGSGYGKDSKMVRRAGYQISMCHQKRIKYGKLDSIET